MKRTICLFLAVLAVLLLAACGGSKRMEGISDDAYDLGCAALETADEYIAGKITGDDAEDKLYSCDVLLGSDRCDGDNDSLVSGAVTLLKIKITSKENGTGTMTAVKEQRNDLAKLLGK